MTRALPPSASVVEATTDEKLHAPAAARNAAAIAALLADCAPSTGTALEIASGTGQHVANFAKALPGLTWQATDVDPARLRSIDAYAAEAGCTNLRPALFLDATTAGWSDTHTDLDLIVLINLLHLIRAEEVRSIIAEAAKALAPGGMLFLYGPFARDGALTSPGDARFDADLRAADPLIGYKDTRDMQTWLGDAGLRIEARPEMPANNLVFICRKP